MLCSRNRIGPRNGICDNTRDRDPGERLDRAGVRQTVAEHPGHTRAEERQGQPRDDLLRTEVDRHDRVDEAQGGSREHRDDEADPWVAGRRGDREPGDRTHEHHPLDPEVQDAGALSEDLADRGEEQDRAARDPRREDQREVDHVVAAARRAMTTRYRVKTSATMRQKRMIPWIIAGTPEGWISRPARINAPNRIDATTTRHGPRCAR